jgi:hypothetical protein
MDVSNVITNLKFRNSTAQAVSRRPRRLISRPMDKLALG